MFPFGSLSWIYSFCTGVRTYVFPFFGSDDGKLRDANKIQRMKTSVSAAVVAGTVFKVTSLVPGIGLLGQTALGIGFASPIIYKHISAERVRENGIKKELNAVLEKAGDLGDEVKEIAELFAKHIAKTEENEDNFRNEILELRTKQDSTIKGYQKDFVEQRQENQKLRKEIKETKNQLTEKIKEGYEKLSKQMKERDQLSVERMKKRDLELKNEIEKSTQTFIAKGFQTLEKNIGQKIERHFTSLEQIRKEEMKRIDQWVGDASKDL